MIDRDAPRLLHIRSEHGYTERRYEALRDEPECVSEAEQRQLTARAHRDAELQRVEAWRVTRSFVLDAVDDFEPHARSDRAISDALRGIRRDVGRIDRRVGAG